MPVLLISGYFTLSDKGALQFVFCCGTRRVYKGLGFLVCINSNTCLNAKLFLRSPNLIACFSHPAFLFYFFFSKIHYSSISSAESCPLLWLYHILLQLCFPNAPNSEGFFIFFYATSLPVSLQVIFFILRALFGEVLSASAAQMLTGAHHTPCFPLSIKSGAAAAT